MAEVEQVMTLAGVGLATSVAAFAFVAVARNDGVPRIAGQEHLALFAQPSNSGRQRAADSRFAPAPDRLVVASPGQPAMIDYDPTATITPASTFQTKVLRRIGGRVIVAGLDGPLSLGLGDVAPGMGRLADIRLIEGRWVAIFETKPAQAQSSR